jgi:hypothetical protein
MLVHLYCTARHLPALDFPHQLRWRLGRGDAELERRLQQLTASLSQPSEGPPGESGLQLMAHLRRVAYGLCLEVEEPTQARLGRWLEQAHGVALMPDQSLRDPWGEPFFQADQSPNPRARLAVSAQAAQRRVNNLRRLRAEGVAVSHPLPAPIEEIELELRDPQEVARRALALFLVALRAEALDSGDPVPVAEMEELQPLGFAALSSAERGFMLHPHPPRQTVMEMSWRYESLLALLWSLGRAELPPASEICDVPTLVDMLMETEEEAFVATAGLRLSSIVLDTLDLHQLYHQVVRQAEQEETEPAVELVPGVVFERHYALNWLTRFEEADWDDISPGI